MTDALAPGAIIPDQATGGSPKMQSTPETQSRTSSVERPSKRSAAGST